MKNLDVINVIPVCKAHWQSLRMSGSGFLIFVILPCLITIFLTYLFAVLKLNFVQSYLVDVLAILAGFLFNALIFLSGKHFDSVVTETPVALTQKKLVKDTFSNVAFTFLYTLLLGFLFINDCKTTTSNNVY